MQCRAESRTAHAAVAESMQRAWEESSWQMNIARGKAKIFKIASLARKHKKDVTGGKLSIVTKEL